MFDDIYWLISVEKFSCYSNRDYYVIWLQCYVCYSTAPIVPFPPIIVKCLGYTDQGLVFLDNFFYDPKIANHVLSYKAISSFLFFFSFFNLFLFYNASWICIYTFFFLAKKKKKNLESFIQFFIF